MLATSLRPINPIFPTPTTMAKLSGAANALKRLAVVLDLPEPRAETDLVASLRARMSQTFEPIPPVEVETGPVMENVMRDDEVDVLK